MIEAFQNGAAGTQVPTDLAFSTSTDSVTAEAMRIDKDGNIGIGTTDPQDVLHVKGNAGAMSIATELTGFAKLEADQLNRRIEFILAPR